VTSSTRACVVQIGQYTLGIAGAYTRQIHSLNELRRVPRAPAALMGFFASRSQVIPIVALEPMLALPTPRHELAVHLEYAGKQFGIGIDAALGFVPFEALQIQPPIVLEPLVDGAMRFGETTIPMLGLPQVLEQLSVVLSPQVTRPVFTAPNTIARVLS
jgi:chemotaxis signal transduction protein